MADLFFGPPEKEEGTMRKKWQQLDECKKIAYSDSSVCFPSVLGVFVFFIAISSFVIIYYALINNPIQHKFVFLHNFIALV